MGHMNNADSEETRPLHTGDETMPIQSRPDQAESAGAAQRPVPAADNDSTAGSGDPPGNDISLSSSSRLRRWLVVLSLVVLLTSAGLSALAGYYSGIDMRTSLESTQVSQAVSEQFELGTQDLQAGRYEMAKSRFEYVIRYNPGYPEVTEKLAEVLLLLNTTATPTAVPTPTLTPTVDLRGAEELFAQAQVMLSEQRWGEAIDTLLKLRKDEPAYQAVEVDSMLYVALRNRGVHRILNEADLEGGTYDLALAERFGPLDVEANNMRTWADLYVTGASFWGLDWSQAAYFFGQLLQVAPNLRDSSNLTAVERFRLAAIKYGDALAQEKMWCEAQAQYEAAFNYGADSSVEPTATWVTNECADAGDEEEEKPEETQPPAGETPTPTPEGEVTPTPEPTEGYPAP
jgi:tetratricopeptide (TPR) repeat protein